METLADTIARELRAKKANLVVNRGTMLADVVNEIYTESYINGNTPSDESGVTLDEYAKSLSNKTQVISNYLKNLVIPAVKEFTTEVTEEVNVLLKKTPAEDIEFRIISVPEIILTNTVVNNMVNESTDTGSLPKIFGKVNIGATFKDVQVITKNLTDVELMPFGIDSKSMRDFIGDFSDLEISDIIETYFQYIGDNIRPWQNLGNGITHRTGLERNLLILILLGYLKDNPAKQTRADSGSYIPTMNSAMFYISSIIKRQLKKLDNQSSIGQVVAYHDQSNRVIYLNKTPYMQLQRVKDNTEIVLGSFVLDKRFTIDTVENIKDDYLSAWQRYAMIKAKEIRSNNTALIQNKITLVYKRQCEELSEEENFFRENNGTNIWNHGLIAEIIESHDDLVKELEHICMEIITKVRFPYTDAYNILCDINNVYQEYDNITEDDAYYYGILIYFVSSMMKMVSVDR